MHITCIMNKLLAHLLKSFSSAASLMLIYAGMLTTLTSVCLPGQARRGSEEEQGDEGGGLSVDEAAGEGKSQKNVCLFVARKKKRREKKKRTQKQLWKKEKVKCESSRLIDVVMGLSKL